MITTLIGLHPQASDTMSGQFICDDGKSPRPKGFACLSLGNLTIYLGAMSLQEQTRWLDTLNQTVQDLRSSVIRHSPGWDI